MASALQIQNRNYKNYINGLKSFACIMVMVGHYLGLYKYAENFPTNNIVTKIFDMLFNSEISFLLSESFWVILFFVVSGYLVSTSEIKNVRVLIEKSVLRFIRLGLPVLFAYATIFVIYKAIGFHTTETSVLFQNAYIQNALSNEYVIWDVIKSPFYVLILGKTSLNGPFWVLREMFFTSLLIYLLKWIENKTNNKNLFWAITAFVFFGSMILSNVIFSGIFGFLVYMFEKDKDKNILSNKIFILAAFVFSVSLYIVPRSILSCFFFTALILLTPRLPFLNMFFSCKIAQFVNKISFGIYSFHWPVFCSFGMLILIDLYPKYGLLVSSVLSAVLSVVITLLISIFYYYAIEKWIYILLKKLKKNRRISK